MENNLGAQSGSGNEQDNSVGKTENSHNTTSHRESHLHYYAAPGAGLRLWVKIAVPLTLTLTLTLTFTLSTTAYFILHQNTVVDVKTTVIGNQVRIDNSGSQASSGGLRSSIGAAGGNTSASAQQAQPPPARPPCLGDIYKDLKQGFPSLAMANEERPFVSSNGIRLFMVPVTANGSNAVLFSEFETRVGDFRTFMKETSQSPQEGEWEPPVSGVPKIRGSWAVPNFPQGEEHPVVWITWNEAKAFCAWLTKRDQADPQHPLIPKNWAYDLPLLDDWTCAFERAYGSVAVLFNNMDGNWADRTLALTSTSDARFYWREADAPCIPGYDDRSVYTSPAGAACSRALGPLKDLAGNVYEMTRINQFTQGENWTTACGGSWLVGADSEERLKFFMQHHFRVTHRYPHVGFRVVLGPAGGAVSVETASGQSESRSAAADHR